MDIEKLLLEYVESVKSKTKGYENIMIYGAGVYARALYRILKNKSIDIKGFVVTDSDLNPDSIFDVKVYDIKNVDLISEKTIFLLGLKRKWNEEVIKLLNSYGYDNYVEVPEGIEYFANEVNTYERPVLEVTAKIGCSVNCRFCPQDILCSKYYIDKNRKREMTFEDFKKCIDKTPSNLILDFSGFVEPFLNKDAVKMLKYADSLGRDIALYTTFVGVTEEIFNEIKTIPFYMVVLHTPDKDNYANIPMTDEYFKVLGMALEMKKTNGTAFIDKANCQSEPHPKVLEFVKNRLTIYSDLTDRAGLLEGEELYRISGIKGKICCKRAKNTDHFVMLPDGSLALCCNDFGLKHIVGNLITQSYDEIINGKEFNDIKASMLCEKDMDIICRDCIFADTITY